MKIYRKIFSLLITRIEVYNFNIKYKNVALTRLARWYDEVYWRFDRPYRIFSFLNILKKRGQI